MNAERLNAENDVERIADLLERRDLANAEELARTTRNTYPDSSEPARLHGLALLMLDRAPEACAAFEDAIRLAPQAFPAYCNLSSALLATGDTAAAVRAVERALAIIPANPLLWSALANACRAGGDHLRARNVYRAALADASDDLNIQLNLAAVEMTLGELAEAERLARQVLSQTQIPRAWLLLGHILKNQCRFEPARDAYARGAALVPNDAVYPYHCGLMDEELHRFESAAAEHARALQLDPRMHLATAQLAFVKRRICDWQGLDALSMDLHEQVGRDNPDVAPFSFLAEDSTAAEQLACARAQTGRMLARTHGAVLPPPPRKPADAPLHVGFVSAGFHAHPTALLAVAMLEELCKLDLRVHLFATSADDGSAIRRRLRGAAHTFHDVVMLPPFEVARRVRAAGIDVLIDLDVWCGGGVPEAFALRPAPVQVNWLGYAGTAGAEFYDYIIADHFVLPGSLRAQFSERIAYLPRCYQPSDPTRVVPDAPPRSAYHLPEDGIVFASFNNAWKINPASFGRMCAVLREVPDSVLWLLDAGRDADARLRTAAQEHDVDAHRLVFSPMLPHAQHLARYRHADLFLDTNPYNAHTTASDALWVDCPVLTRPGDTFASRVAGSLNHFLRMDNMNVPDDETFIAQAVQLARDPGELAALKIRLQRRKRESNLFDMRGYAQDFAALLHTMARRHREGLAPDDIDGASARTASAVG